MTRDHNQEFQDTADRKYAYDFDYVHREYMMRAFEPFLPSGRALEMGCYKGSSPAPWPRGSATSP
jgi:hypothetical protein